MQQCARRSFYLVLDSTTKCVKKNFFSVVLDSQNEPLVYLVLYGLSQKGIEKGIINAFTSMKPNSDPPP